MNLAVFLNVIDALEEIKIKDTNTLKTLFEGRKFDVENVDYSAEVKGVYTVAGKINIEIA